MALLAKLKTRSAAILELTLETVGLVASASAATFALAVGKAVIAVVLAVAAMGFVLRLTSRRRRLAEAKHVRVPLWSRPVAAVLSAMEVAVLVEAVDLPVRLSQPGFVYAHWYIVGIALVAVYLLQQGFLSRFGSPGTPPSAA